MRDELMEEFFENYRDEQVELSVVHDVWKDFLLDFKNDDELFDHIVVVDDQILLRGPSFDLRRADENGTLEN